MSKIEAGFDEQRPEKEQPPVLSIFVIRHAEAWTKKDDPERNLTPEGEQFTDETGEQISDELGNPDQWIINQLDARNQRAKDTSARLVEKLQEQGFNQFFVPIKTGKGGFTGEEKMEISNTPREHTSVPSLAKKIMTVPVEEGGSLMERYQKQLQAEGIEKPTDIQIIQAWLEDDNVPEGVENAQQVKEFFLTALQSQQDKMSVLSKIVPEGKGIATVIGVNNPRMDLLVEAITGVSLKETLESGDEITPRSQGVRIDFRPGQSPEFSVLGRAETSVAEKDEAGKLSARRKPVRAIEAKLADWVEPRPIEAIKVEK